MKDDQRRNTTPIRTYPLGKERRCRQSIMIGSTICPTVAPSLGADAGRLRASHPDRRSEIAYALRSPTNSAGSMPC